MHLAAVNPNCTDAPSSFVRSVHLRKTCARSCGQVQSLRRDQRRDGSTAVYWITVYEIFEQQGVEVVLVNARYAKNVPWRRTDVRMPYGCANCPCTGI